MQRSDKKIDRSGTAGRESNGKGNRVGDNSGRSVRAIEEFEDDGVFERSRGPSGNDTGVDEIVRSSRVDEREVRFVGIWRNRYVKHKGIGRTYSP